METCTKSKHLAPSQAHTYDLTYTYVTKCLRCIPLAGVSLVNRVSVDVNESSVRDDAGAAIIDHSPFEKPTMKRLCVCPTCGGKKIQKCLNCLGVGTVTAN